MTLSASTLSSGLQLLEPTTSESDVINRLTSAFQSYVNEMTCAGVVLTPGSDSVGISAFELALSGITQENVGSQKISDAVVAWWQAQLGLSLTMFLTSPIVTVPPIVPPSGLTGLKVALDAVFVSNLNDRLTLAEACDEVANAIHAACQGATVLGSVPPASPVALPIT